MQRYQAFFLTAVSCCFHLSERRPGLDVRLSLARSQDLLITSVCAAPAPRPQPAGGGIGTTSSEL